MSMEWLEVVIEEYKTLREESLRSMQTQQAVLRYGLAAAGVLLAAAFSVWDQFLLASVVLLLFLPALCYLVLVVWMGEVARMMRAGWYLKQLEDKVNKEFADRPPAFAWENYLRQTAGRAGTPQLFWNYLAIIGLFFLIATAAVVLGNVKVFPEVQVSTLVWIDTLEAICFLVTFFSVLRTGQRFR